MSYRSPEPGSSLFDAVAPWLRVLGVRSWLFLGIAAFMSVVFSVLSAISGIIVPLVFAIVIGMLFYPVVDMLARYGVPRVAGSMLVALLLLAVVVAVLWMMVVGILQQTGTISREITAGIAALKEWLISLNLSAETVDQLVRSARSAAPGAAAGLASFFTSSFSSVIAFLVGLFLGLVLLFYLLYDWHSIMGWVACHLSVPEDLGAMLVKDATSSIRLYYYALTLSSVVVSVSIGLTMLLLGLPLAFTVALVTMITSYIPYLGAILAGMFAFLVSLGAGGLADAILVLLVVLVVQNVVQTIIQTKLASDQLQMHPLVTFISTIVGGALFGLLGATLATPVTAMMLTTQRRMREYRWEHMSTSIEAERRPKELQSEPAE